MFAVIWQLPSELLKPVPCTVIFVPSGPSEGVTTIVGANVVTVKVAEALAPLTPPVTVIR